MKKIIRLIKNQDLDALGTYLEKQNLSLNFTWQGKGNIPISPIGLAIQTGNIELVKLLIDQGSHTNKTISSSRLSAVKMDSGMTNPLYHAIKSQNPAMVKLLTEDITATTELNFSYSWMRSGTLISDRVVKGPNLFNLANELGNKEIIELLKVAQIKKHELTIHNFQRNIDSITDKQETLENQKQKLIKNQQQVKGEISKLVKETGYVPRKPPSKLGK